MKLYATVTSERATKGQGGEYLDIEVKNEAKLVFATIKVRDQKLEICYDGRTEVSAFKDSAWNNGLYDYSDKIKGNKQKDEKEKCKWCGQGQLDYTNPSNPFCHHCIQSQK